MNMSIEHKIDQLYQLVMNGNGTDSNIDKKMSRIIAYVINQNAKAHRIQKTLLLKQQEIDDLTEKITILEEENQRLAEQIDAERAASRNLWKILEKLGEDEATIHFSKL